MDKLTNEQITNIANNISSGIIDECIFMFQIGGGILGVLVILCCLMYKNS